MYFSTYWTSLPNILLVSCLCLLQRETDAVLKWPFAHHFRGTSLSVFIFFPSWEAGSLIAFRKADRQPLAVLPVGGFIKSAPTPAKLKNITVQLQNISVTGIGIAFISVQAWEDTLQFIIVFLITASQMLKMAAFYSVFLSECITVGWHLQNWFKNLLPECYSNQWNILWTGLTAFFTMYLLRGKKVNSVI